MELANNVIIELANDVIVEQDNQLSQEQGNWLHFPHALTREELLNPYLILISFFKDYNLPQYRAFLYQWLEKGLSCFAADEAMPAREIIKVYENLEKLYQAAWLIRQREMQPVLKETAGAKEEKAGETRATAPIKPKTPAATITETAPIAGGKEVTETQTEKTDSIASWRNDSIYAPTLTKKDIISGVEEKEGANGRNPVLNAATYPLHTLDTSITRERQQLLTKTISTVKHKVATAEAVIYLGAINGQPGEMPSIYLPVIVSNDEKKQGHELTSTIEESCKPFASVTALVHSTVIFLKAVERKNYFFCNTLSNPMLYLSGNLLLPLPPEIDKGLINQKRAENFQHWYGQANGFLNGAGYYLNAGTYGLASFSLHQAAENALTAIIRAVLGYRLNIHNLSRLLRITEMFTPELKTVFALDTVEGVQLFNILQKAYNDPRYREGFKPDEASVRLLSRVVSKLLERVKGIYGQAYGE